MRYEVYLDTFFLIQLVMHYCVFMLTASIMKLITSRLRIILAALIAATGSCFMFLPMGINGYIKLIVVFIIIVIASTRIAFHVRGKRQYISMLTTIVAITFLFGGIAQWLLTMPGGDVTVCIWLTFLVLVYGILQYVLKQYRMQKSLFVPVTLMLESMEEMQKEISLVALIDTGNRLRETHTKKPVCILEEGVVALGSGEHYEVVYRTLGNEGAVMKARIIPQMTIHTKEGDISCKEVMLAFYPGKISKNDGYHMILHKEYFKED